MNILDTHRKFRRYCRFEEQLRPSTIKAMKASVRTFVKRTGAENLQDVSLDLVREFFYQGMEEHEWSYWTFMNYYKYLKKFFDWCVKNNHMSANPVLEITKPKKPQALPRRLTHEEGQKLLLESFNYDWRYEFERSRNYVIIAVLLYSGIRCGELINLRLIDINLETGNMLIRSGKGNKDRNVPIHHKLKYALKRYLSERRRLGKRSEFLFVGVFSNKPLLYKDVLRVCKKISKSSGVSFTPHCLRHTFGSVAVEQGVGLPQLQAIMGHSNVASTMIYVKMNSKGLKESLDRVELF
jgi:site-specific recombinase XerD